MSETDKRPTPPPRLLLGAALLFWGAMVDQPLLGLICAFLVEGRSWIRLRWEFGNHAFVRAWWISLAAVTLALAWEWVGGSSYLSLFAILRWLPVLFSPLIFVQQYALQQAFPLNTFSMVARRKMLQDQREGRPVDPVLIHFGYIYLALILIASSFGDVRRGTAFLIGLLIFGGTALFFASRQGRTRPLAWLVCMMLASLVGFGGSLGLQRLYRYIENGEFLHQVAGTEYTDTSITRIGEVGRVKLSHDIRWRMEVEQGGAPGLLSEAVFNNYSGGVWGYVPAAGLSKKEDKEDMAQRGLERYRFAFDPGDFEVDRDEDAGMVRLTGAVAMRGVRTPLPLPAGTRLLDKLRVDGVFHTSLGTTVAENAEVNVLRFEAFHTRGSRNEGNPYLRPDMSVPASDREAVRRVVDELKLRELPPRAALARLRRHFSENFQYTLYQRLPAWMPRAERRSMAHFLETGRRGHCEYFATAATLILREAGIPARYVTGYALKEQSRSGDWLLRGQHAHAWCRAYLGGEKTEELEENEKGEQERYVTWQGGEWVNFDPTPPNWLAIEGSGVPWEQRIKDWWQFLREEILLWRTQEGIRSKVSWGVGLVGGLLFLFIVRRLWRSQLLEKGSRGTSHRTRLARTNPLSKLLRPAEKILGPRPPGQPLSDWIVGLAEDLPALTETLQQVSALYWKDRFDPLGLSPDEESRLNELCRTVRRRL